MRRLTVVAGIAGMAFATSAWGQQAPFCVATNSGTQCLYYNLSACQQAAAGMSGMCTVNPQQSTNQRKPYDVAGALRYPDTVQSGMQAFEAGARVRQAREEHEAKMRLIESQIQAQEQPRSARNVQEPAAATRATYRCTGSDGTVSYSTTPEVGCVVFMVTH